MELREKYNYLEKIIETYHWLMSVTGRTRFRLRSRPPSRSEARLKYFATAFSTEASSVGPTIVGTFLMAAETKAVARLTSIKYLCVYMYVVYMYTPVIKTKEKIHKKGNIQSDALVPGNAYLYLPWIRKSIKKPKNVWEGKFCEPWIRKSNTVFCHLTLTM